MYLGLEKYAIAEAMEDRWGNGCDMKYIDVIMLYQNCYYLPLLWYDHALAHRG